MLLIIKDQISTPYNIYHDTTIQVLNVVEPAIQWHNKLSYLFSSLQMEKLLNANGKSLKDFSCLPFPNFLEMSLFQNKFIVDELNYDIIKLIELLNALLNRLTKEQLGVYEKIMRSIFSGKGGVFYLYGYGGTGKTFLWKTLSAALRSQGNIVLNVASSGIASLLLPGDKTSHSTFCLPLVINKDLTCNIKQGNN